MTCILVLDDDLQMRESLGKLLRKQGYEVLLAADGQAGLELLREHPVQLILTDLKMPGMDGLALLRKVKRLSPEVEIIGFTGQGSIEEAVEAMKQGAWDFLTKPIDRARLLQVVRRALEKQALVQVNQALHAGVAGLRAPRPLIAQSPAMKRVLQLVGQVSASGATVLLQGESGTGKELLARAIHAGSPRKERPLITVNCAAIPEGLLESELFGHEKGAFTGAAARKPGRFELADGSTLFLDEVAELSPAMQAKLLRVLQEREIEPLGATRTLTVDVRILAATNQDLAGLVQERRFREDLYYRLTVITITVPPLRDRPEDLLPLAEHFLRLYAHHAHKAFQGFSPDALTLMRRHAWPGNVRELEHAIQRAVLLATGPEVTAPSLAIYPDAGPSAFPELPQAPTLSDLERANILRTLERCEGNQTRAAQALGINRSTLWRKLKQYGIEER